METAIPSTNLYADTSPFLGAIVVALAAFGLIANWDDYRVRWLAAVAALALLYALGSSSPLHGLLYAVTPLLQKARVTVRALHLYNFALCALAAFGFQRLLEQPRSDSARRFVLGLGAMGLLLLAALSLMAMGGTGATDRACLLALCCCAFAAAALALDRGRIGVPAWTGVAIALVLVELTPLTGRFPHLTEQNQVKFAGTLFRNRDVGEFLRMQPGLTRSLVNDKDCPENFGDWHGVQAYQGYVAGVPENLLEPGLHSRRVQELFGVTHYVGRNPEYPDQAALFEGASGVKVFRNPNPMPRAWAVHAAATAFGETDVGHPWKKVTPFAIPKPGDADAAAEKAQHDRLDQELHQHVAAARADRHAQADLRVRSVTDTSMMFMMPMPPTSSDTPRCSPSRRSSCGRRTSHAGHLLQRPHHEIVGFALAGSVGIAQEVAIRSAARSCRRPTLPDPKFWIWVMPRSFFITVVYGTIDHIVLILSHGGLALVASTHRRRGRARS